LPDIEFEIDPQFAQNMVKRLQFVGDNGLKVSILSANYHNVLVSDKPFTTPDGQEKRRIVIETKVWKKVSG
jgi:hypothetical protein